jgi:hypothetical protein
MTSGQERRNNVGYITSYYHKNKHIFVRYDWLNSFIGIEKCGPIYWAKIDKKFRKDIKRKIKSIYKYVLETIEYRNKAKKFAERNDIIERIAERI